MFMTPVAEVKAAFALYQIFLKTVVLVMADLNVGCNGKSEVCVPYNENKGGCIVCA